MSGEKRTSGHPNYISQHSRGGTSVIHKRLLGDTSLGRWFCFLTLVVIHRRTVHKCRSAEDDAVFTSWETPNMGLDFKSEEPQYCFQRRVSKTWHYGDIYSPLDESVWRVLRDMIVPRGFYGNTNDSESCSARVIFSCRQLCDTCVPRWGWCDGGVGWPPSDRETAIFYFFVQKSLSLDHFDSPHFLKGS